MNGFWSTYRNPPKHSIAITTSLQNLAGNRRESITTSLQRALQMAQAPCPTRRRLEMARQLAANATDTTARTLADRTIGEWWPSMAAKNFRPDTAATTADCSIGGDDDRRMDNPDRRRYPLGHSRRQDRRQ